MWGKFNRRVANVFLEIPSTEVIKTNMPRLYFYKKFAICKFAKPLDFQAKQANLLLKVFNQILLHAGKDPRSGFD